ncbi:hypothetical protein NP493_1639g00014 [Ridgeia piscesae]|uniref:NACHT domain-containing protein n=1 Tax=Ridgeia piscesae TaxID=27915 RepID=A0AAD9JW53_RIDPI|nr:hypothetical protein NP493_1639g00014 [Ridgeia piscesae]
MGNLFTALRTRLHQRNATRAVRRFRRPGYLNWLKASMALKCCGEGLVDLCSYVITTFHTTLITQHGPAVCPFPRIVKKITFDRGSRSWKVNCSCGVCDTWLQSIASELATNQYSWENTDVNEWPLHPWQLAKVKDTRNVIIHSPNLEVTSAELTTYLDKMKDLLQEPALHNYASARRAVDELNEIDATSLDVNVAAVRELECSLYKQMFEEQTTNIEVFKKRLSDDFTRFQQDFQVVRRGVEAVRRDVHDLQGDVGDVRGRASLEKQLRKMHRDSKRHETLKGIFVDLRIQKSRLEPLPERITHRDLEELERRRRDSPVVEISQLFSKLEDDENAPNNVLILGRAGAGKTTLVEKMANDWASKHLWPRIKYVFLVKLRDLLKDGTWSLAELLLRDLQMEETDKNAALNQLVIKSSHVMVLVDGMDEYAGYAYSVGNPPSIEEKVDLSVIISCVIRGSLLPEAKVVVTSRATNQIPSKVFDRVVDVYVFTRDGIRRYVESHYSGNEQLQNFIWQNIKTNPNMATFCHTPVQCGFICATMADMFEHSETDDMQTIQTMTQLYVKATHRLGRKLHPALKEDKGELDLKAIFGILKEPFLKHAALAKESMMRQLKILFSDEDLERHGFDEVDKQTGFLSGARKANPDDRDATIRSWSFSHLSLQEFFAAIGLVLLGSTDDVRKLLENTNSTKQYEIVITFLLGLLGDSSNAYYLKYLGSTDAPLHFCNELITTLKGMLEDDPLKLVTLIYETQSKDLMDHVPEEIESSEIYPMEMLALSWVLEQRRCRVTTLRLTGCGLDIQLLKQLCVGLKANTSIQVLE